MQWTVGTSRATVSEWMKVTVRFVHCFSRERESEVMVIVGLPVGVQYMCIATTLPTISIMK